MPYKNYIYEYYAKISSGEIIVGKWIKKIFEIIINGLQTQEYFFNAKAANKAIKFIETFCHHSKGRNDLITLELWQKAIVSTIFGIQDAEKIRVFREIFIVIGRKNGKSLFASALIAYMAYLEPEYGQEIYCLAPKLDQAALVYDGFYQMVQAEEELEELAKKRRSDIYIAESNTVIKPIAFNAKKSDGFNPQLVVCDEMAAWSGDAGLKQYEVMKSALGARKQPMILSISTDSTLGVCAKISKTSSTPSYIRCKIGVLPAGTYRVRYKAAAASGSESNARVQCTFYSTQTTAYGLLKSTEWTTVEREVTLPESTSTRYLYLYAYTQGAAVYVKDVEVLGQMSVYTEAQLKINSDSITQEVKRAKGIEDELRASIKVNAENITSCVTKGNVGSYITQYYNNVIVAFNNSSKYVQINAGEIAIYDYGVSASKKRAVFDEQGNHFYRDNYYVGKIGTNQWVDNNAHKGLVFDLETQGKYMAWAQKPTEGASSYTTILCYSRANSIFTQVGLHLGCNMYGHGWILDNVDLRNCSANGYTTFTGTLPVVLEIHKTDNNGGIGWTYGNVYIKNGLITSIPQ